MWRWINIAGLITSIVLIFTIPNAGGAVLIVSAVSVGIRMVAEERKRKRSDRTDV